MTRYKLDYFSTPNPQATVRKRSRRWAATFVGGIVFLAFALLFFGGLDTAFRYRGQHQSLQQQHDALRLRYDSLYAAKLQTDKQLNMIRKQLELLQKSTP
ncbi:hypothetical protein [Runella aurantiaca]|uniref:Uncharacterized protein n=1 Tax=Runella aurantiaca TaxID=2282308 RepID=A0A369IE72_9BACT|nr:hypothetical protein [Runella aurantiaca]RDB05534.1 hypothetical protein DVG78_13195 [Runella aurantiaca]